MVSSFHTSPPFEVKLTLPQDSSGFQGNGNAGIVRYHARRIVGSRAGRGHFVFVLPYGEATGLAPALKLPAGTIAD
jgi:hypothetical protein